MLGGETSADFENTGLIQFICFGLFIPPFAPGGEGGIGSGMLGNLGQSQQQKEELNFDMSEFPSLAGGPRYKYLLFNFI